MKLLIVEDERELSDSIVSFLCREDYLCEQAFSSAGIEYAYFCFVEEEMFYEQQHFTEWSDKY